MGEQMYREKDSGQPQHVFMAPHELDRKLWVIAVLAFWVSLVVTFTLFVVSGKWNLISISFNVGTMFLGVWLKARYQLKLKEAQRQSAGDSLD